MHVYDTSLCQELSFSLFLYYRHKPGGITYPQASSNLTMLGTSVSYWVKTKNCLLSSLLTSHLCYLFLFSFLHSTRAISLLSLVCILHNYFLVFWSTAHYLCWFKTWLLTGISIEFPQSFKHLLSASIQIQQTLTEFLHVHFTLIAAAILRSYHYLYFIEKQTTQRS